MKIVAMDLGKNKTVVCVYDAVSGKHRFQTIMTTPQQIHDLIIEESPGRIVFEICSVAGWIFDIAKSLGVKVQIANTNGQAWLHRSHKDTKKIIVHSSLFVVDSLLQNVD